MGEVKLDENGECAHGQPGGVGCAVCKYGPRLAKPTGPNERWIDQLNGEDSGRLNRFYSYLLEHPERWGTRSAESYKTYVAEAMVRLNRGEPEDSFTNHVRSGWSAYLEWLDV